MELSESIATLVGQAVRTRRQGALGGEPGRPMGTGLNKIGRVAILVALARRRPVQEPMEKGRRPRQVFLHCSGCA